MPRWVNCIIIVIIINLPDWTGLIEYAHEVIVAESPVGKPEEMRQFKFFPSQTSNIVENEHRTILTGAVLTYRIIKLAF